MQAERIIQIISEWVKTRPTIYAATLVGSQARGVARPDSDIDLILLVTDPEKFRVDTGWLHEIGWTQIGARPSRWMDEDYGALWSRRLWLEPTGDEIEIGFAMPSWAETRPIDPGTRHVIANGCRSACAGVGRKSAAHSAGLLWSQSQIGWGVQSPYNRPARPWRGKLAECASLFRPTVAAGREASLRAKQSISLAPLQGKMDCFGGYAASQ